jgi:hypothetical protein
MRVLIAGWFSFEGMATTAGDIMARDVASRWLLEAGIPHDVATAPVFGGGVDIGNAEPDKYSDVLFVCGPFRRNVLVDELRDKFSHCRWTGLNLSMLTRLEEWNPFEVLFERDSSRTERPDIVIASAQPKVPVAGFILVHPQPQYGDRAWHARAHEAVETLWRRHRLARIDIDTCLEANAHGLRTAAEIESAISRMDVVVTTRLHGIVLSLKNGVPVVAIDPIRGGAKIAQQARALGWPAVAAVDDLSDAKLDELLQLCLTEDARHLAKQCIARAETLLEQLKSELVASFVAAQSSD